MKNNYKNQVVLQILFYYKIPFILFLFIYSHEEIQQYARANKHDNHASTMWDELRIMPLVPKQEKELPGM